MFRMLKIVFLFINIMLTILNMFRMIKIVLLFMNILLTILNMFRMIKIVFLVMNILLTLYLSIVHQRGVVDAVISIPHYSKII